MLNGDPAATMQLLAAAVIPLLFGISLHEASHGFAARHFGDRTAEMLGRLSLNPIRHIDPVGTVLVPMVLLLLNAPPIGWAKPVPVNAANLRDPRRDMIFVAAAGPASNFAMALGWAFLLVVGREFLPAGTGLRQFILAVSFFGIQINILLAILNMLPIPPLDGGRVLRGLVPERMGVHLDGMERYGLIIVLALFALGILGRILWPAVEAVTRVILRLAGA